MDRGDRGASPIAITSITTVFYDFLNFIDFTQSKLYKTSSSHLYLFKIVGSVRQLIFVTVVSLTAERLANQVIRMFARDRSG